MNSILEKIKSKNTFILFLYNQKKYNKEYFYCFSTIPFFIISFYLSIQNNIESFLYLIGTIIFFSISILPFKELLRVKNIETEIKKEELSYADYVKTIVYTTNWRNYNKNERYSFIYNILDNKYTEKEKLSEYILKFDYNSDIFEKNRS